MRPTVARAAALAVLLPCAVQAEVFVNEIHYDNADTDVGEAIEVVATAGEDLTQYRIVLYNGSTASNASTYDDDVLSTGSVVACGANVQITTLAYAANGLQNGDPDGLALVGPADTVVQFLSYDGTLTAGNGPAAGQTSTDIGVSESGTTPVGHSLQLSGSGTAYGDFAWQAPADGTFGACNTGQSFGAPVDNPPTVVASVPVDGGSLPANQPLSVTFSETVQFGIDWFQLTCTTSGTFEVADTTLSGGPTTYGIDPDGDLVEGESCTLLLDATGILDVDGDPDALVGDATVDFTVAAPTVNAPPEVVSTVPADGTSTFPIAGDLSVTFSEPVDIASGAFTLSCVASTGIVLSHPASGTTVSIDTGTALVHEDTCAFSIDAALVTDADGAQLVAFAAVSFTVASDNSGAYYGQVNDSSPEQLRCSLHEIINDHTVYPYSGSGTSAWTILELAEEHPTDSSKIIDGYRNRVYTKVSDRVGTGSGITYNREHSWPNSLGFGSTGLAPYSDTHMLYLTDTGYNSDRGNMPYANCPQSSGCSEDPTEFNNGRGGGSGTYPGNSNWYTGNGNTGSFEVWNARKGDFARTVMYMAIRYEGGDNVPDLELTDNRALIVGTSSGAATAYMGLLTTILEWHAFDPPDAAELERNEVVYSFQNNRNPFIDHPEWGTLALFQSSQPSECILGTPDPNTAPVAVDDAYAPTEDVPFAVAAAAGVLANDSDADDDAMVAVLLSNAANGVVSLQTDGSFTYTANADFNGSDSFSYRADDGSATSDPVTVALSVSAVNDAPQATATLPDRNAVEGDDIAYGSADAFADVDGDTLSFAAAGMPASLSIDPASGTISGTLVAGDAAAGPYTITVTASDDDGAEAARDFTLTVDPPPADHVFADGFEQARP